jgi:glutamate/tyrosine decarboxylase-like PLP-dependent enzyme
VRRVTHLPTSVTTWAEPQAEPLMGLCQDQNMIGKDEYPNTAGLEVRCVNLLSRPWHSPGARRGGGKRLPPYRGTRVFFMIMALLRI